MQVPFGSTFPNADNLGDHLLHVTQEAFSIGLRADSNTSRSKALQHACRAQANSPGGLDVENSTAFWTARCLSAWDIFLVLQARFWSVRTNALTSKWRRDAADKCPLCPIAGRTSSYIYLLLAIQE